MGIWKGIYQAHMAAKEIDLRKQERAEDIALRQKERAEDQANALELYRMKGLEEKKSVIVNAYLEFARDQREAKKVTAEAQNFFNRLEGIDDPRVELFKSAPRYAAKAEKALLQIEKERQEKGITTGIPLKGATLLDLVPPPSATDNPLTISPDDLFELDFNNPLVYAETLAALTPAAEAEITLPPELSFTPNSKVFEEARTAFDATVLEKAFAARDAVSEKSPEWTPLNEQIENFDKKDSPARQQLRSRFGLVAMAELLESNSPYITTGLDAPEFQPFLAPAQRVVTLRAIIADPAASEEAKQRASALLQNKFGITF